MLVSNLFLVPHAAKFPKLEISPDKLLYCIVLRVENEVNVCDHSLHPMPVLSLHQDHVFRIDPSKVEDGKGKSPYDPRHNAASVLVGELINQNFYFITNSVWLILKFD